MLLYSDKKEDKTFIEVCNVFAKESKCVAKQVGCLIVKNSQILSIGVNGTFPGAVNCNDIFKKEYINDKKQYYMDEIYFNTGNYKKGNEQKWIPIDKDFHRQWQEINEVHAEINALGKANKNGISVEGSICYCNYSPCFNCAKTLYTFGISEIIFQHRFRDFDKVKKLLSNFNILLTQVIFDEDLSLTSIEGCET